MNANEVTVATLVASESFQNYCKKLDQKAISFWEKWIAENPTHLPIVKKARAIVLSLAMEMSDEEVAAEFALLKSEIEQKKFAKKTQLYPLKNKTRRAFPKKWVGIAASFLLLIALAIWQFGWIDISKPTQIATTFGEIQNHLLPDGSKVILNANSTISYKNWSKQSDRIIQLNGEAFFEVKTKENSQKFIVQTPKGNIEVLGTSFNVMQRAKNLEVALLEGKIALITPNYPTIKMEPGELIQLEGKDGFKLIHADVDALSAWRFQRMVFKEVSIAKVIQRLQDEFNWKVTVARKDLLNRKITASIPKNDPELLLNAISEIYDLEIEKIATSNYQIK